MSVCDGCEMPADDAHIRRRIERLELATRFRPIHIQVLLIDAAPPAQSEDYFYRSPGGPDARSKAWRHYFDEIVKCCGLVLNPGMLEESALTEFQHRGFYLAYAVECPIETPDKLDATLERVGPVVIRRVEKSYRPKRIALISTSLAKLIPGFERSELRDRLLLNHGQPFVSPLDLSEGSAPGRTASLSDALSAALPHSA
jgi:hypothetical protein